MSEVLASLKKIGGNVEQYTETVLWTNPDPTTTFNAQAVTLSESMGNYKYIGINFAYSTIYGTGDCESTILLSVEDFRKGGYNTGVRRNTASMVMVNISNTARDRAVYYINDTSVRFDTCYQVASASSDNTNVVPLEILGINELAHGEGVLATPFQLELKSTTANGRSVIAFDKSTFPYTKFRVISKVNNLRYISNGSWVTLAVGDIIDFSVLPDTDLTIDVSGSNTSTASSIEFYN